MWRDKRKTDKSARTSFQCTSSRACSKSLAAITGSFDLWNSLMYGIIYIYI